MDAGSHTAQACDTTDSLLFSDALTLQGAQLGATRGMPSQYIKQMSR